MKTYPAHTGFTPPRLLLMLLMLVACCMASAFAQQAEVESVHREILEILHGEPRSDVEPTPELCKQVANRHQDRSKFKPIDWYLSGAGDCRVTYRPDLRQLHTPMSDKGTVAQFIFDEHKTQRLLALLRQLPKLDSARRFNVQQKFDLQMTLWEMIVALQFRRPIKVDWEPPLDQKLVDQLLSAAFDVLHTTLFSDAEIARLPDNLAQLPQLADMPAIEPTVLRLLRGDESILEIVSPFQMHRGAAEGRVYGRVFLTSDDPQQLRQLQEQLKDEERVSLQGFSWAGAAGKRKAVPSDIQEGLVSLPKQIGSLHTVLVLYFQVLDKDFRVVRTQMVAGWREVWYTGKIDRTADFDAIDPLFHFRIIDYKKDLEGQRPEREFHPLYEVAASETRIVRSTFLDANPAYSGTPVTTLRASCLSCHVNRIKAFDYRGDLGSVGFAPPFRQDVELSNSSLEQRLHDRLKEWSQQFVQHTKE